MNAGQWIEELSKIYRSYGMLLTEEKKEFLLSELSSDVSQANKDDIAEVYDAIIRCFFNKSIHGDVFGDLARIKEQYGNTLEDNYGLSNCPFIDFAKTFWTYKIEVSDLFPQEQNLALYQILNKLEIDISSVFFPTPGPYQIPIEQRKEAQQQILQEFAPDIDIKAFLENNPIIGTRITFVDSPAFKRIVPVVWAIIYIITALVLMLMFGLTLFTLIVGGILVYLASKSIKVSLFGSQRLIDEMTSDKSSSRESNSEYDKL